MEDWRIQKCSGIRFPNHEIKVKNYYIFRGKITCKQNTTNKIDCVITWNYDPTLFSRNFLKNC